MGLPLKPALFSFLAMATWVTSSLADEAGDDLAAALKRAGGWKNYAFTADEKPGAGTGGAVGARYQKGQPLSCTADGIEFFRQGKTVAYRDGDRWLRSKTGITSDPLRVLGAVAKVRAVRLPHEELSDLEKAIGAVKKKKNDDQEVYVSKLSVEAARSLARPQHKEVARGAVARFWLDGDGELVKYTVTIKLQGRIGNADVDWSAVKTVTLSGVGSTEVKVPEAARKALDG